jgi:hypothetical protein
MPIVILDLVRAVRALSRDAGFVALGVLLLLAVAGGTVFYWLVEGLGPLDAAYLAVMSLTTVGYGEPAPETAAGKIFTCFFVVGGMGLLLAFLSMLANEVRRRSVLRAPLARRAAREAEPKELHAGHAVPAGDYDLVVIGTDEASRRTAVDAAAAGLRVVLVEPAQLDERRAA